MAILFFISMGCGGFCFFSFFCSITKEFYYSVVDGRSFSLIILLTASEFKSVTTAAFSSICCCVWYILLDCEGACGCCAVCCGLIGLIHILPLCVLIAMPGRLPLSPLFRVCVGRNGPGVVLFIMLLGSAELKLNGDLAFRFEVVKPIAALSKFRGDNSP